MSARLWITSLVCLTTLTTSAENSALGLGPRMPAPKRPPSAPYVPRIQEYAVVVPKDPHAVEGHTPWEQQRPMAPAYPWGWFGARSHFQPSTHLRYYPEAFDYSVRRGY